jgi:HPt (histidine-containing phosphotransfer) domain-containing protein
MIVTVHIDPAYVGLLREEFGDLAVQLIDLLETTAVDALDEIDAALAVGDDDELRRIAHRLKGGCLNLGASTMASACLALETGTADPVATAAELRASLPPTLRQLREIQRGR